MQIEDKQNTTGGLANQKSTSKASEMSKLPPFAGSLLRRHADTRIGT
jgi:hypothetical protein